MGTVWFLDLEARDEEENEDRISTSYGCRDFETRFNITAVPSFILVASTTTGDFGHHYSE